MRQGSGSSIVLFQNIWYEHPDDFFKLLDILLVRKESQKATFIQLWHLNTVDFLQI